MARTPTLARIIQRRLEAGGLWLDAMGQDHCSHPRYAIEAAITALGTAAVLAGGGR